MVAARRELVLTYPIPLVEGPAVATRCKRLTVQPILRLSPEPGARIVEVTSRAWFLSDASSPQRPGRCVRLRLIGGAAYLRRDRNEVASLRWKYREKKKRTDRRGLGPPKINATVLNKYVRVGAAFSAFAARLARFAELQDAIAQY